MALSMNVSPLHINGTEIFYQLLDFDSSSQLQNLRVQYAGRYGFTRRDSKIIALPLTEEIAPFGEMHKSFVKDDINLIRTLFEQKMISFFADRKRLTKRFSPITIMGRSIELGGGVLQNYIDVKETLLLSIRHLNFQKENTTLGLLLDFSIDKIIVPSAAKLIAEGVDVSGCIVENEIQALDKRLTNQRRIFGLVDSIVGDNLIVKDKMISAPDEISAESAFLEASFHNIKKIVRHVSPKHFLQLLNQLDQCLIERGEGESKFNKVRATAEWFQKLGEIELLNRPGFTGVLFI